jgi:hypothetical protein
MKSIDPFLLVSCAVLLGLCGCQDKRAANSTATAEFSTQTAASNQSIPCTFAAKVLRISPIVYPSGRSRAIDFKQHGYVIDPEPQWEVKLAVVPHSKKTPFQHGERLFYISDVTSVFGTPADQVSGDYNFAFTWNINVPEKPEFENFKAHREEQNK